MGAGEHAGRSRWPVLPSPRSVRLWTTGEQPAAMAEAAGEVHAGLRPRPRAAAAGGAVRPRRRPAAGAAPGRAPPGGRRRVVADPARGPGDRLPAGGPGRAGRPRGRRPPRSGTGPRRLAEHVGRRWVRRRARPLDGGRRGCRRRRCRSTRGRREHRRLDPRGQRRGWTRRETRALLQRRAGRLPDPDQRRAAGRARPGAVRLDRARTGCWSTWRATAARTSSTASTCPAPSAGSPPCSRSRSTCPDRRLGRGPQVGQGAAARDPAPRPRLRRAALPHPADRLPRWPTRRPQVSFNYLGQFDVAAAGGPAPTRCPPGRRPPTPARRRPAPHLLDVVGRVEHDELELVWQLLRPGARRGHDPAAGRAHGRRRCGRSSSTAPSRTPVAAPRRTSRSPGSTSPPSTGWSATAAPSRTSTR